MQKVAFLVERTDERIDCLLNPETLVIRRNAGLRTRSDATGIITGHGLSDDPLIATGGGVTEIEVALLFDADVMRDETLGSIAGAPPIAAEGEEAPAAELDVRDRTRRLWALAENEPGDAGYRAPPRVRLIWGQAWNIRAVVTAVAERLERFTPGGVPQRSWLRLRLRRISEEAAASPEQAATGLPAPEMAGGAQLLDAPQIALPVDPDGVPLLRLDQIAAQRYGDPRLWRCVAEENGIDDPLRLQPGTLLRLPPAAAEA